MSIDINQSLQVPQKVGSARTSNHKAPSTLRFSDPLRGERYSHQRQQAGQWLDRSLCINASEFSSLICERLGTGEAILEADVSVLAG